MCLPPLPEEGRASEDEEAEDSASSVAMAHSEDEETEDVTRKRSRASEELEGTADSSPPVPPPPEEPVSAVPLRAVLPARTIKKPRVGSAW